MTTKDSEIPNVDRGQEQRHLIIRIRCDHESHFGKENNNNKNNLVANFRDPWHNSRLSFISSQTRDLQRGGGSVQLSFLPLLMILHVLNFLSLKTQGLVPSLFRLFPLLLLLLSIMSSFQLTGNEEGQRAKGNADSEERFPSLLWCVDNFTCPFRLWLNPQSA